MRSKFGDLGDQCSEPVSWGSRSPDNIKNEQPTKRTRHTTKSVKVTKKAQLAAPEDEEGGNWNGDGGSEGDD